MHPQDVRACQPKRHKDKRESDRQRQRDSSPGGERERKRDRERGPWPTGSSFCMFFPTPGPALCKLG